VLSGACLVVPITQVSEIGKIMVQGHPGQKVSKTSSQPVKLDIVVYACHPSYTGGTNRIVVQAYPDKNMRLYLKSN
jgi:hypothetical protein